MRWIIILLIIATPAHSAGLYATIGAGKNFHLSSSSTEWNDADSTGAFIAVYYRWDKQDWCKCYLSLNYAHLSQYESGAPWNDESESTIDHIGIAATWEIYKR